MKEYFYNLIRLKIDEGLKDHRIMGGGYILLEDSPINSNVSIKLHADHQASIPMRNNHSIEADGVMDIYVSADPIVSGEIVFIVASNNESFKMNRPSTDIEVSAIGEFDQIAYNQLLELHANNALTLATIAALKEKSLDAATVAALKEKSLDAATVAALSKKITQTYSGGSYSTSTTPVYLTIFSKLYTVDTEVRVSLHMYAFDTAVTGVGHNGINQLMAKVGFDTPVIATYISQPDYRVYIPETGTIILKAGETLSIVHNKKTDHGTTYSVHETPLN